jgi:hypothetical protein
MNHWDKAARWMKGYRGQNGVFKSQAQDTAARFRFRPARNGNEHGET